MSNKELNFVDLTDAFTKNMYIENTPNPQPGTSLQPVDVGQLPEPVKKLKVKNKKSEQQETENQKTETKPKKSRAPYTKVSNKQKEYFTVLYGEHKTDWEPKQYADEVGIKIDRAKEFYSLLNNGKPLHKESHYKKKSRTTPYQTLVKEIIDRDPSTSIKTMREIIIRKKMLEDEIKNAENKNDNLEQMSVDFILEETKGMELEDPKKEWNVPSESSIRRYLKGETGKGELRDIPVFTFKRETRRAAVANTEENKTARQEAVTDLRRYMAGGYKWVCLDEASWRVASTPCYGWSERGKKCFITKAKGGLRLTSLTSIQYEGFSFCDIVAGPVTKEIYEYYFKRVIEHFDKLNIKCVFWADNCSIHGSMKSLVEGTNHIVLFNSAYSPEINPIENIFGIWKRNAERDIREWENIEELIDKIKQSFQKISQETFISTYEKVRNEVWYKVQMREDI